MINITKGSQHLDSSNAFHLVLLNTGNTIPWPVLELCNAPARANEQRLKPLQPLQSDHKQLL